MASAPDGRQAVPGHQPPRRDVRHHLRADLLERRDPGGDVDLELRAHTVTCVRAGAAGLLAFVSDPRTATTAAAIGMATAVRAQIPATLVDVPGPKASAHLGATLSDGVGRDVEAARQRPRDDQLHPGEDASRRGPAQRKVGLGRRVADRGPSRDENQDEGGQEHEDQDGDPDGAAVVPAREGARRVQRAHGARVRQRPSVPAGRRSADQQEERQQSHPDDGQDRQCARQDVADPPWREWRAAQASDRTRPGQLTEAADEQEGDTGDAGQDAQHCAALHPAGHHRADGYEHRDEQEDDPGDCDHAPCVLLGREPGDRRALGSVGADRAERPPDTEADEQDEQRRDDGRHRTPCINESRH